jgi:hypothetical protein
MQGGIRLECLRCHGDVTVVGSDSDPAQLRSTMDYDAVLARQVQQSIADREAQILKHTKPIKNSLLQKSAL